MPPSAQAGHCCTPEQQAPTGRPKTPDTAKLLQRALASSSGSALLNSLSQGGSSSHPLRPLGVANRSTEAVAGVAARSESAHQPLAGPIEVPGPRAALVSTCLSTATADNIKSAAMGLAASASAQTGSSIDGCGVVVGPLTDQEALSQQQGQHPVANYQSSRLQPAGADQQQQVELSSASARLVELSSASARQVELSLASARQGDLSSATAQQQKSAGQAAKWEQQPWTDSQTGGQVIPDVQAASGEQTAMGLHQVEEHQGHTAEALQQEGARPSGLKSSASNTADLAGHVTAQVQRSTGRYQMAVMLITGACQ